MSRFFSGKYAALEPYTPGEQPRDRRYVKLNTNESPFPPCAAAVEAAAEAAKDLQLYPDPDSTLLTRKLAETLGVEPCNIIVNNGSDETLNFAFMAFCDEKHPAVFPDITYGFYPVFAALNGVPYREIPLEADFSVDIKKYTETNETVFLANPNAPTGVALPLAEIETLVRSNPDRVVVIDEAYVDFGAESAVPLTRKYDNLLVVQTFSKSRSLAGGRLGFGVGAKDLIADLNTIKYSTNPYNISRVTSAVGVALLNNEDLTRARCAEIAGTREYTVQKLNGMGFECTPSKANFIFTQSPRISGGDLYRELKNRGVLVRHFEKERIKNYNRVTVGSREEMEIFLARVREILEERS